MQVAAAQNFPTRPIKLVVTYPPGGTVDAVARIVAPTLSLRLGQPVIVENRGGAGGMIGGMAVAKSPADGYTLMVDASNYAQNPALHSKMPFDTLGDFSPVSLLVKVPNILVVNPNYPVYSVADLIARAKAAPGAINYASSGNGSSPHLAAELFDSLAKTRMTHVAYKGGGPALIDVMAGQVPVFFASLGSSLQYVKSGKLRPIAVASRTRSAMLPDVPTIAQSGLPGYEMYEWNAVFAPVGTPRAVVERLSAAFSAALGDAKTHARLAGLGAEVVGSTPAELDTFRRAEIAKWQRVVTENKLSLD
ncbi:MAG: tripartite tricarboxylate transporter substrate binding protein [Burkholderiaceae bacterium]